MNDASSPAATARQDATALTARALLLGHRLPAVPLTGLPRLAAAPTTIGYGARGFAVLFRFGAVVLFGVTAEEEADLLATMADASGEAPKLLASEDASLRVDPDAGEGIDEDGRIVLHDLSPERLQTVADVLAKTVALDHHERRAAAAFDRVEPFASALSSGRRVREQTRELLRHIGDALMTELRMTGRVEVSENPEVLWEHPELERLHLRLVREYELHERDRALARKLDLLSRTVTTVLDLTHTRHSLRVEWYIVILIVVEILLTLYDLFWRGA